MDKDYKINNNLNYIGLQNNVSSHLLKPSSLQTQNQSQQHSSNRNIEKPQIHDFPSVRQISLNPNSFLANVYQKNQWSKTQGENNQEAEKIPKNPPVKVSKEPNTQKQSTKAEEIRSKLDFSNPVLQLSQSYLEMNTVEKKGLRSDSSVRRISIMKN